MAGETKAEDKDLQSVLSGQHYAIDYYQREYVWEKKQVEELMSDFLTRFNEDYDPAHKLDEVKTYNRYFLGSFIVSEDNKNTYIIDGQQRLTTLTLLLMALMHKAEETGDKLPKVEDFIHSVDYGTSNFNISVEGRDEIMDNLLNYPTRKKIETEHLDSPLVGRYFDLVRIIEDRIPEESLMHFYYWLTRRVMLVRISAQNEKEAYAIFETMNDRGKPLTSIDMFKGYALSSIDNKEDRYACQEMWKTVQDRLGSQMTQFVTDLLKAKYSKAETDYRGDWRDIAQYCHRWFKENRTKSHINITTSEDIVELIKSFDYYSSLYLRIQEYTETLTPGYENVSYYGAFNGIYLPVLMSVMDVKDPQEKEKLNIMSTFMDIRTAQHVWNHDNGLDGNTVRVFLKVIQQVRMHPEYKDANVLAWVLTKLLEKQPGFKKDKVPTLTRSKKVQTGIYFYLARLTTFLEVRDNRQNPWNILADKKTRYDIEHLLAANYERNSGEYSTQEELDLVRNKIGALGLLDKSTNSSLNNKPFHVKVHKYAEHNRLLGILSPALYKEGTNSFENHPGLERLRLSDPHLQQLMRPYVAFSRESIDERTEMMFHLSKHVWNVARLLEHTSFDSFKDLEEYAYDREFSQDLALEQPEEVPEGTKETGRRPSHKIKSVAPGETVRIRAHVGRKGVYDTKIRAEADHTGKVRIREIIGLVERPIATPMPLVEQLRSDIVNGRIGSVTETAPGVYNWQGETEWIPASRALAVVKAIPSSLQDWELDE